MNTAFELGYTEPNPRDDLGGVDVARKALILARLLGWELEMDQVYYYEYYEYYGIQRCPSLRVDPPHPR